MKMIALIALGAVAMTAPAEAGNAPRWETVGKINGATYIANVTSIERTTMDHANLPTGARILVYRDDGGKLDINEFYTMEFDCRGNFMLWNHPEAFSKIKPGSIASLVEDVACWGPTK